jgi:hypothetical protein
MSHGPVHPDEYGDSEGINTDAGLREQGFAAGLDVWEQVKKAYGQYLGTDVLANAQLWSLRQAIRAELLAQQAPLLRFAQAAAKHACSDSVDEWNDMIEVWNALPDAARRELLS